MRISQGGKDQDICCCVQSRQLTLLHESAEDDSPLKLPLHRGRSVARLIDTIPREHESCIHSVAYHAPEGIQKMGDSLTFPKTADVQEDAARDPELRTDLVALGEPLLSAHPERLHVDALRNEINTVPTDPVRGGHGSAVKPWYLRGVDA